MRKTSILLAFNSCTEDDYDKPSVSEEKSINGHEERLNKKHLTFDEFLKLDNTTEVNDFAKKK